MSLISYIKTLWAAGETPAINYTNLSKIENGIYNVTEEVISHLIDYTLQIPYGGASTNSGNNYSIAVPAIAALTEGKAVSFKCNADSTAAVTLNWDGKGAKSIKKANGTDMTLLKTGGIYTVRYNGTNFILQGDGGSIINVADVKLAVSYEDGEGVKTGTYDAKVYATGTLSSLTSGTPTNISGLAFTPKYFMITGYYDDGAGNSGYSYMAAARGTSIHAGEAYTSLSSISIRNWGWLSDGITVMPGINYTLVKWIAWND